MSDTIPAMQYIRLGNTGLKVSRICLGCMGYGNPEIVPWTWSLRMEEALPHFQKALELGINFFDTADIYSHGESERIVGTAIKKFVKNRNDVVIATKLYLGFEKDGKSNAFLDPNRNFLNRHGLSRKKIFASVDESLERLQMDYIDLLQIHSWDNDTPIEETMEALHDVIKSGKIRYIGASNLLAWQFAKAQQVAKMRGFTPFISMQSLYNLLYREEEREMIPLCRDMSIGFLPWSPLSGGSLARKSGSATTSVRASSGFGGIFPHYAVDDAIVKQVMELAAKKNISNAQIAIAWLLHKPSIAAPIIGPSTLNN